MMVRQTIGLWALLLAAAPSLAGVPALAGEVTATGGALGLGTAVNGAVGGSCGVGLCQVGGGTAAGSNLFHRFSAFDTRGGINGVNFSTGGLPNVFVGVTSPLGTFIDKLVSFSGPINLFWLSPGGISLSGAGGFTNIQQLNLGTATGWRVGNGLFDAAGTTAGQAALLSGTPVTGLAGAVNDPAALAILGLQKNGDLSLAGGLLTVDQGLLLDAQGGNVLLQAAGLQAPGGRVEIQGSAVLQATPIDVSGASGGSVAIKATGSVLNSAPIQANGTTGVGGSIRLQAGGSVVQSVGANLEASGASAGGSIQVQGGKSLFSSASLSALGTGPLAMGGTVQLSAPTVHLVAAQLDASGAAGGGTVLLGGDTRGANPAVANASITTVDGASTVRADALAKGDGGKVVMWSEQQTSFAGTASARGGPSGGDGGFLEVSSRGGVGFSGSVDAVAPAGKAGSVLFDAKNITIDSYASAHLFAKENLQFYTNASWDSDKGSVVLTPSETYKVGSFFYDTALSLADNASFSTSFQFQISESKGDGLGQDGADGLVFVVKNSKVAAIGGNGGKIGYGDMPNSLGIKFDTYRNNNSEYSDPSGNHVGINLNGSMQSVTTAIIAPDMNGCTPLCTPWTAWIDYNGKSKIVDVRLANNSNIRPDDPALSYELPSGLKDIVGEVNGSSLASFGFTSATGGGAGKHEILAWSLSAPSSSLFSSNPSGDLLLHPSQIQAIANQGTNVVLQANNDIALKPNSSITNQSPSAGAGGITMQAGRSITLESPITYFGDYSGPINLIANDSRVLPNFRDSGVGDLIVNQGAALTSSNDLISLILGQSHDIYSPGILQVNAPITANTVLVRGSSGITLSGGAALTASASSGRAIALDAGSGAFLNAAGPAALAVQQPNASWVIYADSPTSTPPENLGGLVYNFKQYNQSFEESNPILGSGNGLLFATNPTLSVNLVSATPEVNKVYDGNVKANLVASNYHLAGVLPGDSVIVSNPATGAYGNKNAGTGKLVSVSGLTVTSATEIASGVPVYGYSLPSPDAWGAIGTITKAPLTISAETDSRDYNGTPISSGVPTVTSGQVFSGDTLNNLSQEFGSKNVLGANQSTLTVTGYTMTDGNNGNNYAVSLAAAAGTISQLALSDAVIAPGNSSYGSALAPGAVSFGNIVGSDAVGSSAVVNTTTLSTSGNPIVGSYTQTATGLTGADAANYSFSGFTTATPNYTINKLALGYGLTTANTKVYDGNVQASFNTSATSSQLLKGDVVDVTGIGRFVDPNVGLAKRVLFFGLDLTGPDAGNYTSINGSQLPLTADISIRPLSTWSGSTAGLWSDSANWDALPSGSNVATVAIPVGTGAVSYDAAAGGTQLQSLFNAQSLSINGGSLAVSGATTVASGANLSLNAGAFSTASLLNQGLVNGSGPLVLKGLYTESGGSLGTGFSRVTITQTSGDLSLKGVGATGPISLASSAGDLNLSGALQSSSGALIDLSANGRLQLGSGAALTSPGGTISLLSTGPLRLQEAKVDAGGGSAGGTVNVDGATIALSGSTLNTSGSKDGGLIQIGKRTLASSVSITNSKLIADPPGIGGLITVDGRVITTAGSTFNVYGLSGGLITLGSPSTNSISLDAFSSLIGGGGASFGLFANSILNNANLVGGTLFVNGQPALASSAPVPSIVSFQSSIDPIQSSLVNNIVDYTAPGSPLMVQWEQLGIDPLSISLTESGFLYANSFFATDSPPLSVWDGARPELLDTALPLQGTSLYATGLTLNQDLAAQGFSLTSDALVVGASLVGGAPVTATSPTKSTGEPAQAGQVPFATANSLTFEQQIDPSKDFSGVWPEAAQLSLSITGTGVVGQAVQQLSPQQVNAQFTSSEQKAMDQTASKLGLDPAAARAVPTPAELQSSLRQVIEAVRRRVRGAAP